MKNFGMEDGNDTHWVRVRYSYSFINTGLQAGEFRQRGHQPFQRLLAAYRGVAHLSTGREKAVKTANSRGECVSTGLKPGVNEMIGFRPGSCDS